MMSSSMEGVERKRERERERRKRNRNPKGKPYNIIDKVEGQARGKQGPK